MQRLLSLIAAIILSLSSFELPSQDTPPQEITYIVNINTDKFHLPTCSHADSIKEKNRWEYTGPRETLIEFHYVPCKVCNP